MTPPDSDEKQAQKASNPHAGWLTRSQAAAELGYRSIFPVRKMEGTKLHPVRGVRGWLFDPTEVAALKAARAAESTAATPLSEGRLAARVFHLFDHGSELREIVQELEVPPRVVRDLWQEWLIGLEDGESDRRRNAEQQRRQRAQEQEMRELERRSEQEQKTFESLMSAITGATAGGKGK
jgi:hypothetical protein